MTIESAPAPPFSEDQLKDIQGFGIAGFNKDHQESLFIKANSVDGATKFVAWLLPRLANAWEVSTFNSLFREIKQRQAREPLAVTWTALGISAAGYGVLGVSLSDLPAGDSAEAFQAGMAARAVEIGDTQPGDAPESWLQPFQPGMAMVHFVIVVAADKADDLTEEVGAILDKVSATGCAVVFSERGGTLPPPLTGHEHFGFKDGISQPAIVGYGQQPSADEPQAVAPGEFVVGFPDQTETVTEAGPNWQNGSFLVFRRLVQHVFAFRELADNGITGSAPAVTASQLAADMIGRWPSGAPVELFPTSDPGPGHAENNFAYAANDQDGHICPVWAHIRKSNPRDESTPGDAADDPTLHRMIRRGIPFGPPLAPDATQDDGISRGLHFYSVVSDLVRQFEFVQSNWINNPNFPIGSAPAVPGGPYSPPETGREAGGPDPVVGEHGSDAVCQLQQASGVVPFPVPTELVNVTAGEYFFLPGLAAIQSLVEVTNTSSNES